MTIQTSPLVAFGGAGASPDLSPILPIPNPKLEPDFLDLAGLEPWKPAPQESSFSEEFKARFTLSGQAHRPLFMEPMCLGVSPFLKPHEALLAQSGDPYLPFKTMGLSPIAKEKEPSFELDELRLFAQSFLSQAMPKSSGHISPELVISGQPKQAEGSFNQESKEMEEIESLSQDALNRAFLEQSH